MHPNPAFSRVLMPLLSVELKWDSKPGMNYQIEESTDLLHWEPALPNPLAGTGNELSWKAPPTAGKNKNYRVRES